MEVNLEGPDLPSALLHRDELAVRRRLLREGPGRGGAPPDLPRRSGKRRRGKHCALITGFTAPGAFRFPENPRLLFQ